MIADYIKTVKKILPVDWLEWRCDKCGVPHYTLSQKRLEEIKRDHRCRVKK